MNSFEISTSWFNEEMELLRPNYSYSNAGILPSVLELWGDKFPELNTDLNTLLKHKSLQKQLKERDVPKNIIYIIVDGLGTENIKNFEGSITKNLEELGLAAHSSFPTLTGTNMVSLSTGLTPAVHGVIGANIYHEKLRTEYHTISGMYLNNGNPQSVLTNDSVTEYMLGHPFTIRLKELGADSNILLPVEYTSVGLVSFICQGLSPKFYKNPQEILQIAGELLRKDNQQVISIYMGYPDHTAHNYGVNSSEYHQSVKLTEQVIDALREHPSVISGETMILLSSDHGHMQVKRPKFVTGLKQLQNDGIKLSSSGRTLHVYTSDVGDKTFEKLSELIGNFGIVVSQEEAFKLAGNGILSVDEVIKAEHSKEGKKHYIGLVENRLGQYVILMKPEVQLIVPEIIKFGDYISPLKSEHGSLSKEELFVPVCVW